MGQGALKDRPSLQKPLGRGSWAWRRVGIDFELLKGYRRARSRAPMNLPSVLAPSGDETRRAIGALLGRRTRATKRRTLSPLDSWGFGLWWAAPLRRGPRPTPRRPFPSGRRRSASPGRRQELREGLVDLLRRGIGSATCARRPTRPWGPRSRASKRLVGVLAPDGEGGAEGVKVG